MLIKSLVNSVERFSSRNSNTILSAVGVVGVFTTVFLTAKGTFKAVEVVADEEKDINRSLTPKEFIELTWTFYVPAATSAISTVTAIVLANRLSSKRTLAAASALVVTERMYDEYVDKVQERLGKARATKIRDEIAQDVVHKSPPKDGVIVVNELEALCLDAYSGRYFHSSMEVLRRAQNDINYMILNHDRATLSDYYHAVGLSSTACSDEIGWTSDQKFDLLFSTAITNNGQPCIVVNFNRNPKIK